MRKLVFLFFLFLTSCSSEVSYQCDREYKCFGVNIETKELEIVNVLFEIKSEEDVFLLLTNYQNYLPVGYTSFGNSNIDLIKCETVNNEIYYHVDNYVFLVDITLFLEQLNLTCSLYDFGEAHLLFNNIEIY